MSGKGFINNMDIKINLAGLIIEIEGFPYKEVPENMVPFICNNERKQISNIESWWKVS